MMNNKIFLIKNFFINKLLQTNFLILVFVLNIIPLFSKSGTTVGEFLRINPDTYITSLGEGAYGIEGYNLNNPASFAFYYRNLLSFSYFPWILDDMKYYFAGSVITTSFGNMGVGGAIFSYGNIVGYDNFQNPISLTESNETLGIFSFSKVIKRTVPVETIYGSFGVNIKFLKSQLTDYSAESVAGDVGVLYKLPYSDKYPFLGNISLGASYQNLGSKMKFVTVESYLPESISLGLCYNDLNRIIVVGDVSFLQNNNSVVYSGGISFVPIKPLSLSFGYRYSDRILHNGLRVGFNISFLGTTFEYSYTPMSEFNNVHKVGIKLLFDTIDQTRMVKTYLLEQLDLARDYCRRGNYTMAKSILDDINTIYPDNPAVIKLNEEIDNKIKKYSSIKENFIKRNLKRAENSLRKGDLISAQRYYNAITSVDPNNPYLDDIRIGIDKLKQDLKQQKIVKENTKKIKTLFKTGVKYFMYGEYIKSKEQFEQILKIVPGHKEALEYIAKIDAQLGMVTATQINDIFMKGLDLYKKGDYEEALKYFEAVIIAAPQRTDAVSYINLCQQQIKAREEEKQKQAILQKQKEVQNEMSKLFNRSLELYERERYEEAFNSFTKSFNMASEYKFENYKTESAKYLSTIRTILAERYFKEGFKLQQQNKLDSALNFYKKSLEYKPDNLAAQTEIEKISKTLARQYYEQGMQYYTSGEIEKAKEMLRKSLSYEDREETRRALDRIK